MHEQQHGSNEYYRSDEYYDASEYHNDHHDRKYHNGHDDNNDYAIIWWLTTGVLSHREPAAYLDECRSMAGRR